MDSTDKTCTKCQKTQAEVPLKRCAKCQNQLYCSRDCQKADWKAHKAFCASSQQSGTQSAPKATTNFDGMPKVARDFFKNICPDNYLHQFSEKDAFGQLIDCYRMRIEDDYSFAGDTRGLYNEDDPLADFQEFLDMAEIRNGILPSWWSDGERMECEERAMDTSQWSDLNSAVEKQDIIDHYGDATMPMKLRLLAEKIYGKKIEGT